MLNPRKFVLPEVGELYATALKLLPRPSMPRNLSEPIVSPINPLRTKDRGGESYIINIVKH